MKSTTIKKLNLVGLCICFVFSFTAIAQVGGWNADLEKDAKEALKKMLEKTPKLESFKNKAYGYVVFPKITKAGIGIGGAAGRGIVYQNNTVIGSSKLKQASIGLQLGGQQYREVIFFENKEISEIFNVN